MKFIVVKVKNKTKHGSRFHGAHIPVGCERPGVNRRVIHMVVYCKLEQSVMKERKEM